MRVTDAIDMLETLLSEIGNVEVIFSPEQGRPVQKMMVPLQKPNLDAATITWLNSTHSRN